MNPKQLKKTVDRIVWGAQVEPSPTWKRLLRRVLQVIYLVARDLLDGQLSLRAMSLVYMTLLALVPLLAVSFSLLKGFGVHNQIEPMLLNFLEPLGEKGREISSRLIEFVDNVNVGVLGSVSLGLLIFIVVFLIQKIEAAFNYTWNVKRTRPFAQRFSEYLSVIVIGPLFLFSALGIKASLMSTEVVKKLMAMESLGGLLLEATAAMPLFLIIGAFTFFYVLVPNTRVRLHSAFVGAVVAGILWQAIGQWFASFGMNSTRYMAIYSGFAILILFMLWLYLSWLILLVGAIIAFYTQHPEALASRRREVRLSSREQEKLALLVMFHIGYSHYNHRPAWTMEGLTRRLRVPGEALKPLLKTLQHHGLLSRTADEPPSYVPARPLETTELKEVLYAARAAHGDSDLVSGRLASEPAVDQVEDHLNQALGQALGGSTVKELALSEPPPPATVTAADKQRTGAKVAGKPDGDNHKR